MPGTEYEFSVTSRIAVGAIGEPGHRTFFIQASEGETTISLKMEKEQVSALAQGIDDLLLELEHQELLRTLSMDEPSPLDLELALPIEPRFVVGHMGLAFDDDSNRILLVIHELADEDDEDASVARIWSTPETLGALSRHARDVVAGGRPICPLCNRPIDPDGHFCPGGNGHSTEVAQD